MHTSLGINNSGDGTPSLVTQLESYNIFNENIQGSNFLFPNYLINFFIKKFRLQGL